jgi:hypothetical protein
MQLPGYEQAEFDCRWMPPPPRRQRDKAERPWFSDGHPPRLVKVDGVVMEMWPVAAVEQAIGRKRVTLRRWEQSGILPLSPFVPSSEHWQGRRRLYPTRLVHSLAEIAQRHGVQGGGRPSEAFARDVQAAFERARRQARQATSNPW